MRASLASYMAVLMNRPPCKTQLLIYGILIQVYLEPFSIRPPKKEGYKVNSMNQRNDSVNGSLKSIG